MNEHDKKWNFQCEKLVELKRKTGCCMVPTKHEQDKSLGQWVATQRCINNNDKTPGRNRIRLEG
jgi:hypothetical protein